MNAFYQASYFLSELIALTGIILNASQIVKTLQTKGKKSAFELTILSLSTADFLSSIFTVSHIVYWHLKDNYLASHKPSLDFVSQIGLQFGILSSIFHLVFIATQRTFAAVSPLKFRLHFTISFCNGCLVVIWALSFGLSAVNVFAITKADIIGYFCVISEASLLVTYTITCYIIKRQNRMARVLSSRSHTRKSTVRAAFLHSISVTFAFILCTLPAALFHINVLKRVSSTDYLYEWVRWMFYMNPTLDSVLYFYFKRKQITTPQFLYSFTGQHSSFYNLENARRQASKESFLSSKYKLKHSHWNAAMEQETSKL
eukprot:gene15098-6274_t